VVNEACPPTKSVPATAVDSVPTPADTIFLTNPVVRAPRLCSALKPDSTCFVMYVALEGADPVDDAPTTQVLAVAQTYALESVVLKNTSPAEQVLGTVVPCTMRRAVLVGCPNSAQDTNNNNASFFISPPR
jgi:hypothetical protein